MAQHEGNIIPQPVHLQWKADSFAIDKNVSVNFDKTNKHLLSAAEFLRAHIKSISGIDLPFHNNKSRHILLLITNEKDSNDEGYKMAVSTAGIKISANNRAGIVYGLQTLFQTLPAIRTNAALIVQGMELSDYPRFKWRGMHLDVSRHFFSPELVKQYIDLMAAYKMNRFHWHLVDDQGWRIEIKKYPKLTSVGAWRVDQTDKSWSKRPQALPAEKPTYGGYYTQEQIKEIIDYAAIRNVTIVPEIEMPGHVASAIASYPNLSCTQLPQLPLTGGDYSNIASNYCAGNDSVFSFLEDVLTEVIDLFPSKYIHIGGDEVDKTSWKKCPRCQARMKAEGLKNEEQLQSYFIRRIEKFVASKGRRIIGWDEILEGGLAPSATVMSWRGEAGGIEAARQHHDVIMTPGNPVYFDQYQGEPSSEPEAIGGFNTLKEVYAYEPVPAELNEQQSKYVLGAQANLWAEYITTPNHVLYMILPRMLALSEVVWSPKTTHSWNDFNRRVQHHLNAFDQLGIPHSKGNFKVDIKPTPTNDQLFVTLSTEVYEGDVYYSTDGHDPDLQSKKYDQPVRIDSSILLKAVSAKGDKILSKIPAQQHFVMHKAIGRDVRYQYPISRAYMADGPRSLTDGVKGTESVTQYWHGISDQDLVATVNLGEVTEIESVSIGFLQNYRDWILMPQSVQIDLSADGDNFIPVYTISNEVPADEVATTMKEFEAHFPAQKARFVRVTAKRNILPAGHPGAGKPAWIFADEIEVN